MTRAEGLAAYVERLLAAQGSMPDAAQQRAMARLQQLADELATFAAVRRSALRRLITRPPVPRGVYLWGGVGRGKSLLMDAFFATVPVRRKVRVHFHAFMRDVHRAMGEHKRAPDPLRLVAADIARRHRLVAFDEFHVADIADAMILGRLFGALFDLGTVFVLTSNYPPEGLYPDGLQRQNFLPTIGLLRRWLDVVEVDGGVDYRLRTLEQASVWHVPAGAAADVAMARTFDALSGGVELPAVLSIEGRDIVARRCAGGAAWFDFEALCDGPRSQRDYLEIAQRFPVVLLSDVPRMDRSRADAARRFTWLVDILYDHKVKLVVSAETEADALYLDGPNAREFPRTVSRLIEMRSRDYMALPHVAAA